MTDANENAGDGEKAEKAETEPETTPKTTKAKVLDILRRVVVGAIVAMVVAGIVGAVMLSHARKEMHRGLTVISRDLLRQYEMAEEKADEHEGPRLFVFNGQEIEVETGHEQASVDELMSEMPGDCHRVDEGGESHQTCMEGGSTLSDLRGLVTGEPPDMSRLKYRYAVGEDEGGTFYINLSPKTNFDPLALWSETEDVPGPEHSDIPRPPDARRIVSAHERGRPYLASMFLGSPGMTPRELKEYYRSNMDPRIWSESQLSDDPDDFMVFRRNGAPHRFVTITFDPGESAEDSENGTVTVIAEAQ